MVTQYPDTIYITVYGEPVKDEATGIFSDAPKQVYQFRCRAEKNSEGKMISGTDGNQIGYNFTVYMPRTDVVIPIGSEYELIKGEMAATGRVLDAINGQLNSRIWL